MKLQFLTVCLLAGTTLSASAQNETKAMALVPLASVGEQPENFFDLDEVIFGKYPLVLTLSQLTSRWREFDYEGVHCFTKDDGHTINNKDYLIAYVLEPLANRELSGPGYVEKVAGYGDGFGPESRLRITLLPLRGVTAALTGPQANLRPFDMKRYVSTFEVVGKSPAYYQNLSLVYLRKLNEALQSYSRTYLNTLPEMGTAFAMRKELEPFADNVVIFTQPGTTSPFKANPLLSGRKRIHLKGKGQVIVFYEGTAAPDGSRAVLQYNGRVARVSGKEWAKLRELSGLGEK